MTKQVLVTGASGFIASHTILELLNHGYKVKGTIRDLKNADKVRDNLAKHHAGAKDIELVAASLTEKEGWNEAVKDCEGVFHLASPVPVAQPKNPDEVIVPAREGTLNLLNAAVNEGIKRVVITSSVASVAGNADAGNMVQTDEHWTDINRTGVTPYAISKTIAEQAAWDFQKQNPSLALSTVNPALVLGPALESDYGSSLEALILLLKGAYPALPKLYFGIVDVRDVASLHRLVFESDDAVGTRYLCSKGNQRFIDIAKIIATACPEYKKKLPKMELPNFVVKLLAIFDPVIASIANDLELEVEYDIEPAIALGWMPRTTEDAIVAGAKSLIDLKLV